MTEPVIWREGNPPFSPRFDDVYHSEAGAAAQARHVFLAGCELPGAWANAPQWRILETGFGLGINFLTTWQAWRDDPARPDRLHFVSVEAFPVAAADLVRAAQAQGPALAALAGDLARQWHGLLPGVHRLSFDQGHVLLTLCIGDVRPVLRTLQRFDADSIFLDGFSPQKNPQMWAPEALKTVARFARPGTRIATWTVARPVRDALAPLGFVTEKAAGLPPKRDCLRGIYAPAWPVRRPPGDPAQVNAPQDCIVVGAGLAGAAVAASLARRGWRVTVLEAGAMPASGASGLPAGVLAPHVSPDDALLSRLTRAGARMTWQQLHEHLGGREGIDWARTGVLERRTPDTATRLPPGWHADGQNESWIALPDVVAAAGLPPDAAALLHTDAGWVRPTALVHAWLATPGVHLRTNARVACVWPDSAGGWMAQDATGAVIARAARLVIACGAATAQLIETLPLQPVRGQLAWGRMPTGAPWPWSDRPLNGDGHLIPAVPAPDDAAPGTGPIWISGATFSPGDAGDELRAEDAEANLVRLKRLHPSAATSLAGGAVHAWAGVRCAATDRRPLVGPVPISGANGHAEVPTLWVSTAMGSRGLAFAGLCAELLAARWHGEPLPVSAALAAALDTRRVS